MKILHLNSWQICIPEHWQPIQQDNIIVVLNEQKDYLFLVSADDNGVMIEKCSADCRCEADYENKKLIIM